MGREKKQCKIRGCENMGTSLGKRGKGENRKPYYSTVCKKHRNFKNEVI